jgi:hypothetical protein
MIRVGGAGGGKWTEGLPVRFEWLALSQRICPFCKLIHAADSGQCLVNAVTVEVNWPKNQMSGFACVHWPTVWIRQDAKLADISTVATQFWSGGHPAHFCGSLGDSEEGTARLVISAPVITALRIWPNRSVNVFGVCGIKMVLL